ncbi:MAG: hypothetical protein AAGG55_04880 [Pseudomonadota bacterium]
MQRYAWEWLAKAGAAAGVIISLGMVAYEMKQARELAMAELYLERSAHISEVVSARYTTDTLEQAFLQAAKDPQRISYPQARALDGNAERLLIYAESMHFLHISGLSSDEEWLANKTYVEDVILHPCIVRFWGNTKNSWRESFALEIDDLIESSEINAGDCETPGRDDLENDLRVAAER